MFGLPVATAINQPLSKKAVYEKFNLKASEREQFDVDISRLVIIHRIDAGTIPAVQSGKEVKSIWILAVLLKRQNYNLKNIEMLFKLIPQRMILDLQFGDETQLAAFDGMMVTSSWQKTEEQQLALKGIDLDSVWNNLIAQVANVVVAEGKDVREQIEENARQEALQKKIEALEKKARAERQTYRKMEMFEEIQKLKKTLV
ncbi:MAG: DUF4391 domain-containing protein [Bacteroidales bacterium]|nr:DUF4391 domain-containing protein [Bacteroidales bacterium]